MRLKDKVAIIVGSSGGIGFEIASEYLKEGASVTITGITEEEVSTAKDKLSSIYPNGNILGLVVDHTKQSDVENLFKTTIDNFKKLDILVNNAGIAPYKPLEDMSDDDFFKVIDINLGGAFRCTREALKYMKENGGSIINTSSFVSLYGASTQSAYSASKAGMNGLTKSNAKELGKYKIRVNAVAPGVVMTEMVKNTVPSEKVEMLNKMTPIGRAASPSDIAGIYVYLASDESLCTTGTIINIDGGLVM